MKYPIGIQNFKDLVNNDCVYVDKTRQIYDLVENGKYYFLSRPRRFGKSLLLSTMQAYFEGRSELFHGLAIEQLETHWIEYPVLYIDVNSGNYSDSDGLEKALDFVLSRYERMYGVEDIGASPALRFGDLIRRAYQQTGRQVVILIDEYDKPLLETINDQTLQDRYRSQLKAFYSQLKTQGEFIRFVFMTGVTRFGHVSIFSDLNNLQDISMLDRYASICGLTEAEIHYYFDSQVGEMAAKNDLSKDECYAKLRKMYDGYHFNHNSEGLYNPFSVLNALSTACFDNYWFRTGTPTFLVELFRESDYNLDHMVDEPKSVSDILEIDAQRRDPISVLYQSGYLTITGVDEASGFYWLDFPNLEVERGFLEFLVPYYWKKSRSSGVLAVLSLKQDVLAGRPDKFLEKLKDFLDSGDYRVDGKMEIYFQNTMFVIFRMLGLDVEVERATASGRIDLVVQTDKFIYLMEFKLDGSADEALAQIDSRGYTLRFARDSRRLYKLGVNFSSKTRSIADCKIE